MIATIHKTPRTLVNNANEILRAFDKNFNQPVGSDYLPSNTPVNVYEVEGGYNIELIAAGFKKEEITLSVKNGLLTIKSVEQKSEENNSDKEAPKVIRKEFVVKPFERNFKLPKSIDQESLKANFEDGILSIAMKKHKDVDVVKEITIL